jgi:phage-related protein
MREIEFYRTASGRCPVEEFLDSLSDKQARKVTWVLRLIKTLNPVPKQYFKMLTATEGIWEVRIQFGNDIFRILSFFDGTQLVVLANGFAKKTQKVPQQEIELAQQRRKDYFERKQ